MAVILIRCSMGSTSVLDADQEKYSICIQSTRSLMAPAAVAVLSFLRLSAPMASYMLSDPSYSPAQPRHNVTPSRSRE